MDALRVEDFGFAYPSGKKALDRISLSLADGDFTLLTGPTGCGKSTLLRSIKPEVAPHGKRAGSIKVFGHDVRSLDVGASSRLVGLVSQSPESQIICETVWHELAFGLENLGLEQSALRRRVAEVAYFFGIESWMHQSTATLSGGQKQILVLASVLAMQPRLLLLDEPTAELDPIAAKNFLHALFRVNREQGVTVLVATHAAQEMEDYAKAVVNLPEMSCPAAPKVVNLSEMSCPAAPKVVNLSEMSFPAATLEENNAESPAQTGGSSQDHPGLTATSCQGPARGAASPVLDLCDVRLRYARDSAWVLRGIDLTVTRGSIHAIVGGNASGKSTLLRVMAQVLRPQRGRVLNNLSGAQAYFPQEVKALFTRDSVAEELCEWQGNVSYKAGGLAAYAREFRLDEALTQHPYDLSGGQQQMLALGKILLAKPQLLLLDEPTKGLDASSKCVVADILEGQRRAGVTIVLVSHDLGFVSKVADEVSMVFDGELACSEPTDDFFDGNLFYRPLPDAFLQCRPPGIPADASRKGGAEEEEIAGQARKCGAEEEEIAGLSLRPLSRNRNDGVAEEIAGLSLRPLSRNRNDPSPANFRHPRRNTPC